MRFCVREGSYERLRKPAAHWCASRLLRAFLVGATVLWNVGCSTEPAVQMVQPGPAEEMTFDGLVSVERSNFTRAWVKPGVDFSMYRKIHVADPLFEFRPPGQVDGGSVGAKQFPLGSDDKESPIDTVHETFLEELTRGCHYAL